MIGNLIAIILIIVALALLGYWAWQRHLGKRAFAAPCCQSGCAGCHGCSGAAEMARKLEEGICQTARK
ncbi:MAG: hypothetical protein LBL67_05740 [Coriobacteriales bacterium]|jgi:hypothetical protein|nr:hypothetical protein [Coriobacteriales bacterium]